VTVTVLVCVADDVLLFVADAAPVETLAEFPLAVLVELAVFDAVPPVLPLVADVPPMAAPPLALASADWYVPFDWSMSLPAELKPLFENAACPVPTAVAWTTRVCPEGSVTVTVPVWLADALLVLLADAAPAVTVAELLLAVLLEVAVFVQLPPWFPEVAGPNVIAGPSLADASQCCPVWLDCPMPFQASFPPEFAAES
jgi:hypothetical protein